MDVGAHSSSSSETKADAAPVFARAASSMEGFRIAGAGFEPATFGL
jgi:hypothetical protein